jgi:hypothetical protein
VIRMIIKSARKPSLVVACLAVCAQLLVEDATAATYRVDDSATMPRESSAAMKWSRPQGANAEFNDIEGSTTVQVRLNLAPWLKRNGRVFLVLPEQPGAPVNVSWTTQGRLLPGQLISGQRALVLAGPINVERLDETMVLRIRTDGTRMTAAQRLNFHFEIDVD